MVSKFIKQLLENIYAEISVARAMDVRKMYSAKLEIT